MSAARRGVEEAALRAWAAVRAHRGLVALRRQALRRRLSALLRSRAVAARRRLLGRRGFGAFDAALLRSAGERDVAAEAEAGRARAALARWRRRAKTRKMLRAARTEQVLFNEIKNNNAEENNVLTTVFEQSLRLPCTGLQGLKLPV